jgi:hypothetical protein
MSRDRFDMKYMTPDDIDEWVRERHNVMFRDEKKID